MSRKKQGAKGKGRGTGKRAQRARYWLSGRMKKRKIRNVARHGKRQVQEKHKVYVPARDRNAPKAWVVGGTQAAKPNLTEADARRRWEASRKRFSGEGYKPR